MTTNRFVQLPCGFPGTKVPVSLASLFVPQSYTRTIGSKKLPNDTNWANNRADIRIILS